MAASGAVCCPGRGVWHDHNGGEKVFERVEGPGARKGPVVLHKSYCTGLLHVLSLQTLKVQSTQERIGLRIHVPLCKRCRTTVEAIAHWFVRHLWSLSRWQWCTAK